jgi:hypothetical protein
MSTIAIIEPTIVNLENIHECTYNFIRENNIRVINFEESMTDVYLKMVMADYRFTVDRDLIHEIFCEIVYRLNPNDPINSDRLLMTMTVIMDDSDSDDNDNDNDNDNDDDNDDDNDNDNDNDDN